MARDRFGKPGWQPTVFALGLLSMVLLTGCDPLYGISRRARVAFMPEPGKVGAVVRATPGVDEVQYRFDIGGRPVTLTGLKPPDQVHTFSYRGGSNIQGSLQFVVDYKQNVDYSQSLMQLGGPPPRASINATRRVMIEIEKRLEDDCGLINLQSLVVERCVRVKCQ